MSNKTAYRQKPCFTFKSRKCKRDHRGMSYRLGNDVSMFKVILWANNRNLTNIILNGIVGVEKGIESYLAFKRNLILIGLGN